MVSSYVSVLLGGLAAAGQARAGSVDSFVAHEQTVALQGVLNNIGADGSLVPGAAAGLVVASPSKTNPNYFYTWTRDSALTLRMLVDELIFGNTKVQGVIEDYVKAQAVLQTVSNPSGTLLPYGLGLGEPKFNVDGTRFNGAWGRPQRDGPALRAITLIDYCNWLLDRGEHKQVSEVIWPVIANDISYVGQYWNTSGYDLWEEVYGSSFFTTQNHYKSLVAARQLADKIGATCTGCIEAPNVLCFLQTFWNGDFLTANINVDSGRSGIDANTMLGAISVFDVAADCSHPSLQPCHSRSLASFKVFVDTFRNGSLYAVNEGVPSSAGVALGRYPEDVYFNGNPWYLITQGAAEFLYDAVAQWTRQGAIAVDATSEAFFRDLYPAARAGETYRRNAKDTTKGKGAPPRAAFQAIVHAATAYADSFVAVAEKYTPRDGSLSEQFDKSTGQPLSAIDLTWSYAAFVTMARRRAGHYPKYSWTQSAPAAVPSVCLASSTNGVYAPATAAGAPNVTASCTSGVLFVVNASTYYGENVYLVGNTTDLGAWDLANAQPLSANNYTSERPEWFAEVQMTAGEYVSYVFVREEDCGQASIYETVNRTLLVPACDENATPNSPPLLTTDNAWTGPTGSSGGC
ncbi:glucoamylase [Sporothrix brasiliensis 5110]|uniref:Glucoamylase n=1 Tax=Sporothrix brasiliensis 5110 TaxID=1398154 RepID=A0A0C2IXS0_9PEZI|nr:glucoamylase [Sporothrix brasiliensis 5110]KIH89837.1 glucoamylase [Sporothrix brasiliensis 5110]